MNGAIFLLFVHLVRQHQQGTPPPPRCAEQQVTEEPRNVADLGAALKELPVSERQMQKAGTMRELR